MWTLTSVNPYNGEVNATFETLSDEQVIAKIEKAQETFLQWKNTSFAERKELFYKMAEVIEADLEEYAKLQTQEMWMLYTSSVVGLKGTGDLIRWFADNAQDLIGEKEFDLNGTKWKEMYDPLGVIFGIGPWNFPYNQILRAAVPNILAWNTQVYKHASNVPMCAAQIEDFFLKAWFPEWVYQNIFISSSQSELILSHKHVRGVNLTGWERAGAAIGSLAGKYLKPSVLELGWNDAFVLADHSDTKQMVAEATACRIANGGQKCNSSKRFIVMEKHYDSFVEEMGKYMKSMKIWDPMLAETQIPPMARTDLVDEIHEQVQRSVMQWARLVCGWNKAWSRGEYYEGTVLADVTPEIASYHEEVFGPVASIIKSKNLQDSIRIANDSDFGLSAVVYWDDIEQCREVAGQLEWWMIFVNAGAWSKPHLPFGWVRKSWYGKENGPEGLRAFMNKKVIVY